MALYFFCPTRILRTAKILKFVKCLLYDVNLPSILNFNSTYIKLYHITSSFADEEKYAKKISEMFVYDFFSLADKTSKTDVGGVDFVYSGVLDNFLLNAEDTYYKYIESNIYGNRDQKLPEVGDITIESVKTEPYTIAGGATDEKAYYVKLNWDYTSEDFNSYQKSAELVFMHNDIRLDLVELQK